MNKAKAVRALKNKNLREQLSINEQAQLGNRIGIAEIDVSLLDVVAGGGAGGHSYSGAKTCAPTWCCACQQ